MGSEIPANIEKNRPCNLKVVAVGDQFAIFVDDVQVGGLITPPVKYESGRWVFALIITPSPATPSPCAP